MLCFFDGGGGMRVAVAWRLFMDQVDLMDQMDKMGAPRYTPGVAVPQFGMARAQIYRRGMQRTDLPQGKTGKNPAARLKEPATAPTGKSVRDF